MLPSIHRGRLTVATLFVVAVACDAGFCVGLPLAIGETSGAFAFAPGLLLILLLFWMLWRGSLVAKWLAIALFVVQALWTGGGALIVRFEDIPPANDPSSQAIVQYFVYGAAAWTLFAVASALVLALSPSVQEFLRVQRAIYSKMPGDHVGREKASGVE